MATTDPSASLVSLSQTALQHAHDRLHEATQDGVSPADAEAHHLIAEELRKRGVNHPHSDDRIHDVVVTMSSVRVPIKSLSKMLGANEVNAIAQMALTNGTSFADVHELLTSNGWVLRAEPASPSEDPEADTEEESDVEEEYANLNPRQIALAEAYEKIAEDHGLFDQTADGNGAHYIAAEDNVFAEAGIKCSNCVFFRGGNKCEVVSGKIEPEAACKLWVIDTALVEKGHGAHKFTTPETGENCSVCGQPADNWRHRVAARKAEDSFAPPKGAQEAGDRALRWIREGYAGKGFTGVGLARARDLSNGKNLSADTVRRMSAFFTRHGSGRSEFWELKDGKPTPWRVAWDAWGGDAGRTWADNLTARMTEKSLVVKQVEEQKFTLGPWYVPNALDAHEEWTDPDELQSALWDYVKKGNREIRLQHIKDTRAGEWVEAMTLPFPMDCPLINPDTGQITKRTFPAGTVMLGVVWDDWAWDMVKAGQIRGYSIGGSSERREEEPPIYVDLDTGGL